MNSNTVWAEYLRFLKITNFIEIIFFSHNLHLKSVTNVERWQKYVSCMKLHSPRFYPRPLLALYLIFQPFIPTSIQCGNTPSVLSLTALVAVIYIIYSTYSLKYFERTPERWETGDKSLCFGWVVVVWPVCSAERRLSRACQCLGAHCPDDHNKIRGWFAGGYNGTYFSTIHTFNARRNTWELAAQCPDDHIKRRS